jgi:hypothetical protein
MPCLYNAVKGWHQAKKATMRKGLALLFAVIVWFAVIAQLILMIQNRTASVPETIIRFFSFFTILTNTIVALFFTGQVLNIGRTYRPGILSAVTVYIFMVGIVYQFLLRHIWQPKGLQLIVDELLHTINPLIVLLYWYLYEKKSLVNYHQIKGWLVYPFTYLVYIMIRGSFSGFYPYPFVNVAEIGLPRALVNSVVLTLFFIVISFVLVIVGRKTERKRLLPT